LVVFFGLLQQYIGLQNEYLLKSLLEIITDFTSNVQDDKPAKLG